MVDDGVESNDGTLSEQSSKIMSEAMNDEQNDFSYTNLEPPGANNARGSAFVDFGDTNQLKEA